MTDHHWDDDFDVPDDIPDLDQHELPAAAPDDLLPDWDTPEHPDTPQLVETEIAEIGDPAAADDTVFPPAIDVGDLPEPVDGFPWIDTATLGVADPGGFTPPTEPVGAHELAAYAAADLPDGADPWAVLAADEDPATSALARWWTPGEQ